MNQKTKRIVETVSFDYKFKMEEVQQSVSLAKLQIKVTENHLALNSHYN